MLEDIYNSYYGLNSKIEKMVFELSRDYDRSSDNGSYSLSPVYLDDVENAIRSEFCEEICPYKGENCQERNDCIKEKIINRLK